MVNRIDKNTIDEIILSGRIEWQKYSLQRMMQRETSGSEVKNSVLAGVIIKSYEDDRPYPRLLIANIKKEKPLHVVASFDEKNRICYIITAYMPDEKYFERDLITRKTDERK